MVENKMVRALSEAPPPVRWQPLPSVMPFPLSTSRSFSLAPSPPKFSNMSVCDMDCSTDMAIESMEKALKCVREVIGDTG